VDATLPATLQVPAIAVLVMACDRVTVSRSIDQLLQYALVFSYCAPCGSGASIISKRVCVCPRIDPLCFLAGCRRRRLNQGLVVALDFLSVLDRACFLCVNFLVSGCMLCLVC